MFNLCSSTWPKSQLRADWAYIEHWLRILKGDASAIIHAASKAEQAFNYLKAFRSPEESCDAENQRATAVEEPA